MHSLCLHSAEEPIISECLEGGNKSPWCRDRLRRHDLWDEVPLGTEGSGPHFTNGFSIAIQIRLKFSLTLISILIQWSLQNFVHDTAVLSWHVKKLLRSDGQQRNYSKAKFPSNLNCGQKIVSETGPWNWMGTWPSSMSSWIAGRRADSWACADEWASEGSPAKKNTCTWASLVSGLTRGGHE